MAKQVLDVTQYCIAKQHVLWDIHEGDVVVEHGPGLERPKLLLLDVFMAPDPILGKRLRNLSSHVSFGLAMRNLGVNLAFPEGMWRKQ